MTENPDKSAMTEILWRKMLQTGEFMREAQQRKILRFLPGNMRCKSCYAPFDGIGSTIAWHLYHKRPSNVNPKLCTTCEEFARTYPGGVEIELSLLFADVRGSTTIAEGMSPAEFGKLINRFYKTATDVLADSDAIIDKIIGDQAAGIFVPGFAGSDHAQKAIDAGKRILSLTGHGSKKGPWIPLGVGIHTGTAYVGSLGSTGVTDITVLGDVANTAARLSSSAGIGEIYISEAASQYAGYDGSENLEKRELALKGKKNKIIVKVFSKYTSVNPLPAPVVPRINKQIDTIIVGGGQGGLSISYYLAQKGRDHIIFEQADQAAEVWRNRWDSFTLITPNWMTRLPGAEYNGEAPDNFMPREEIVSYFEDYIKMFDLPINYETRVTSIKPNKTGYQVITDTAEFEATNVVIAAGLHQQPKIPTFSTKLSSKIHQIHTSEYRNPNDLPSGAVLVVGSAQSGCQIAEELYQSGRKVYLSVGNSGRIPRRYRGKDITSWFYDIGFYDKTVDKLPSPKAKFAGSVHGTGKDGGHTINLHQFVNDGVILLGHIQDIDKTQIILAADLHESLEKADQFEVGVVNQIDEYIEKMELDSPTEILPQLKDGFEVEETLNLDLESAGISSVIWATGYSFDFDFIKIPVFDDDGYPIQNRGVSSFPGLYFIGLPFLHTNQSGLLAGVGADAAHVAEHIVSRLVSDS